MNVRLPYSRKKRYLTGIDWVIAALDRMSRRATGGSNASQIVLELNGPFDAQRFARAMTEFAGLFPVLNGRSTRDWNLAPYWRMPRRSAEGGVRIAMEDAAPRESGLPWSGTSMRPSSSPANTSRFASSAKGPTVRGWPCGSII